MPNLHWIRVEARSVVSVPRRRREIFGKGELRRPSQASPAFRATARFGRFRRVRRNSEAIRFGSQCRPGTNFLLHVSSANDPADTRDTSFKIRLAVRTVPLDIAYVKTAITNKCLHGRSCARLERATNS